MEEVPPEEGSPAPICVVGESGVPIHYLCTGETTIYCDEALTLTCSALSDVFPDMMPSTMAFAQDGKILPLSSRIAAGSTVELKSVKDNAEARIQRFASPCNNDNNVVFESKTTPTPGAVVVNYEGVELTIPIPGKAVDEYTLRCRACNVLGTAPTSYRVKSVYNGAPDTFHVGDVAILTRVTPPASRKGKKSKSQMPITVTIPGGRVVKVETTTRGTPAIDVLLEICRDHDLSPLTNYELIHRGHAKTAQILFPGTQCKIVEKEK